MDKVEIFKTKKLPVEFLSDNKLVFQEYSHLRTITVSQTGLTMMMGMMKLTMVVDYMLKTTMVRLRMIKTTMLRVVLVKPIVGMMTTTCSTRSNCSTSST